MDGLPGMTMETRIADESFDMSAAEEILRRAGLLLPRPTVGRALRLATERAIPILQEIQEAYGYLPEPVIRWIASAVSNTATSRE